MAVEAEKLAHIDRANISHQAARSALKATLGADPEAAVATRVEETAIRKAAVEKLRAARSALDQYLASESSLTAVVGFLSSVKEKRALRARLAIGDLVLG
ncbi:MAG: hypothetical protein ACRC14_07340, partial [Paracoccaceae bacterium]